MITHYTGEPEDDDGKSMIDNSVDGGTGYDDEYNDDSEADEIPIVLKSRFVTAKKQPYLCFLNHKSLTLSLSLSVMLSR